MRGIESGKEAEKQEIRNRLRPEKVIPCPFCDCGGDEIDVCEEGAYHLFVHCKSCEGNPGRTSLLYITYEEAVRAAWEEWQTRPPLQPSEALGNL